MSNNVQDLINNIKTDGFEEAQKNAGVLEAEAKKKAEGIIRDAEAKAERIVADAKEAAAKFDLATRAALEQAARNVLLTLKQDILDLLKKLIAKDVGAALSGNKLAELVGIVAKNVAVSAQVTLSASDIEALKTDCLSKLQQEAKNGITFSARRDRARGLTVSFDQQKSCFDLTENALVDYFAAFVSDEIAKIIRK